MNIDVFGVTFKKYGRKYYFSPGHLDIKCGMNVIVETERGFQYAEVVTDKTSINKKTLLSPVKSIIRIATKEDDIIYQNNLKDAENAAKKCNELIEKFNLDMRLIDTSYNFERTHLYFTYLSSDRVDFRELAKELAKVFKVRIELRQVGPRDKAKEIGGIGPCGRPLCCSEFLYSFNNITINMAKNQNISLNPTKINGLCNRLLCCLDYEDETYTLLKKDLPKVGTIKNYDDKKGKVISVDPISMTYKVQFEDGEITDMRRNEGR